MTEKRSRDRGRGRRGQDRPPMRRPQMDDDVKKSIEEAETFLIDSMGYYAIPDLNPFQRKQVYRYFEKTQEYAVKAYREEEKVTLRVYPVGAIKRLAEQKTQEVVMSGKTASLPPMGSYERFVVHDYLKDRDGIRTDSAGESGVDRHIIISPVFGRSNKKAKKKRLMR